MSLHVSVLHMELKHLLEALEHNPELAYALEEHLRTHPLPKRPEVTRAFVHPPETTEYTFDPICRQIVLELEKRNWRADGYKVAFSEYGEKYKRFQVVRSIRGPDFVLEFGRGDWAVNAIRCSLGILNVYSDYSGPTYTRFVEGAWERDREYLLTKPLVNAKLNREPRRYLRYTGSHQTDRWDSSNNKTRKSYLIPEPHDDREHDPNERDPRCLVFADLERAFTDLLASALDHLASTQSIPTSKE